MRRRIFFGDRFGDPAGHIFGKRDVFRRGKFDKTVRQIGIARRQRDLDILRDDVGRIPQGRIGSDIRQGCGIVLRSQDGAGVAGMRPQQRAPRHAGHCRADPPPHPEKPCVSTSHEMVCRF
jgi:hypothetical protein